MAGVVRLVSSVVILPVLIVFILTGADEVTSKRERVDIKPTPSLENHGIERISATSSADSQFTHVSPAYGNHPDEIQPSVSTEVDDNFNIIIQRAHADLTASSVHSQFPLVSLARTYPAYGNHPDEIYPSVSAEVDFITHRTQADLTVSSAHGQFTHVSQVWTDMVYGNYPDQIQPSVSTATEMVDLLDTIPERTHTDLTTPSIRSQFAHVSPAWTDLVYESHPREIHSSVSAEVGEHQDITAQRKDIQFGSSPAQIPQTTGLQTQATTFSEPVETITLVERLDLLSSSSVFAASTRSSGIPDSESSSSSLSFDRKDAVETTSLAPVHEHNAIILSSEITSSCIIKQRHLKFTADEGEIYFEKRRETSTPYPGKHKQCTLQIEVPDTKIVHFTLFSFLANCQYFSLTVRDCGRSFRILYSFCRYTYTTFPSETVYTSNSFSNCILIQVRDNFEYQNYSLGINFTAALENSIPQLEVQFTSPMSGFIQTPGWNRSAPHPSPMDSFVRIDVPQNHSVLISFEHLDMSGTMPSCVLDILQLFLDGNDQINEVQDICGNAPPSPRLYHPKDTMYAQFKSYRNVNVHNGFRLRFTFHNYSALPEQLSDRKWNCSVPHWADFKQHIPCNLVPDCVSGEDEEDCPYSSDACGQGHFSVGGTCYRYVTSNHKLTWEEASAACLNRGERLASLSTLEKWYGVLEVLLNYGNRGGFLGLKSSNPSLPSIYRFTWQWLDNTIAHFVEISGVIRRPVCALKLHTMTSLIVVECDKQESDSFICEVGALQKPWTSDASIIVPPLQPQDALNNDTHTGVLQCPGGHVTYDFLACDEQSACWTHDLDASASCKSPLTPFPPSLTCTNGVQRVPYTLVCDLRADCSDHSDEDFCVFPECKTSDNFDCGNHQCVSMECRCDGVWQCLNGVDEMQCPDPPMTYENTQTPPPPAIVNFGQLGEVTVTPVNVTSSCPETHFQCPGDGYCLPVFTRCNGVYDCPGKEDEEACDRFACPGFYRCRGSHTCLHPDHLCDGVVQCPQRDDELLCQASCPENCTCYGLAFNCRQRFSVRTYRALRFLDASGTGMSPADVANNSMLIHLSLARCGLTHLNDVSLLNLRILDLSDNHLQTVPLSNIASFPNLQTLILSGNPLSMPLFKEPPVRVSLPSLHSLVLTNVHFQELDVAYFRMFPDLQFLNLSHCGVERVHQDGFQPLADLEGLDLRGCPLTEFPREVLRRLDKLNILFADNYKLCCPAVLPEGFNSINCHAPQDEISSCDDLLRSDMYRLFLALFATLALLGNVISFAVRVFACRSSSDLGFGVFVTHLCLSDFLMGVYLAVIGVADRLYRGEYLWNDTFWKSSAVCRVAGFLSLLSSEVSAFIICLITLDRFLVLRFPFSQIHFRKVSANVASMVVWAIGLALAAVPLLPMTSHWQFYGQTGICIPLPITRATYSGHGYSFGVMIVLNFVLFVLIAAGQASIYWSIRTNSMSVGNTTRQSKDLAIARRLITIAMSDFLCWFPIGLLGLLASNGFPIESEVNVAMAIFVLPLNSALNPFLYTLNLIMEKRRLVKEEKMRKRLEIRLQTVLTSKSVSNTSVTVTD